MKISKRLRVISDFIPDNSLFLDIGCDHALLDIYAVKNKKEVRAIASDINEGPVKSAKDNVKKYNLEQRIKVVKKDGLNSYEKGVDIVILSGLGSHTIVNILKERKDLLKDIETIIISSNNDYYYLRKNIMKLGYYIKDEKMVLDKGKYYPIILFKKGNKKYKKYDLKYGPILLKSKDKELIDYIEKEKSKLKEIYKKLSIKYLLKKHVIKREIRFLEKLR